MLRFACVNEEMTTPPLPLISKKEEIVVVAAAVHLILLNHLDVSRPFEMSVNFLKNL